MRHAALVLALVAACAPRGEFRIDPAAAPPGEVEAVFVATTRDSDATGAFTGRRADQASFLRYDVSVPPDRDLGQVNWPGPARKTDPRRDFLTVAARRFDQPGDFRADLARAVAGADRPDAVVYVHGFNNTLAEGVYRVAQLDRDLEVPGVAVHYAWPSRASPFGYVYDRDSALFARDGLEDLLDQVAASGARKIVVIAHSMGAALTMETLRQLAISGDRTILPRLAGVVLISPDLDVDVFRAQARRIGALPQPFIIFGSRRDRILGLSATLSGEEARLGNLTDLSRISDLKVTYLDTAAYNEGAGHFNVASSPALIRLLDGIGEVDAAFRGDDRARVGLFPGLVLTVQNATQVILSPAGAVAEGLRPGAEEERFPGVR